MTIKIDVVTATGASTFTTPADWNPPWQIHAIAAGGGASRGSSAAVPGTGGGGGGWSKITDSDATLAANSSLFCNVGLGGPGGASTGSNGTTGGDTWANVSSNAAPTLTSQGVLAKGGTRALGAGNGTLGAGGLASGGVGSSKKNGGDGGGPGAAPAGRGGRGGGGAGGPNGDGGPGGTADQANSGNGGGSGGGGAGGGGSGTVGGSGGTPNSTTGANGGDSAAGTGHGTGSGSAAGTDGTVGGGGGGGFSSSTGFAGGKGGPGADWTRTSDSTTHGPGGGGAGGGARTSTGTGPTGGNGGLYGGGGGGGGGSITTANGAAGAGANGVIILVWTASTQYPQSCLGSTAPAASRVNAVTKTGTSTTALVAGLVNATGKITRVATSSLASLTTNKTTAANRTATSSPLAGLVRSAGKVATGSTSPLASMSRVATHVISALAASTPVTSLVRSTLKVAQVATAPVASLLRQIARAVQATASSVASIVTSLNDRYWVGGTGNWSDAANHWSKTDGGSPGASVPTSVNRVFFTNNSAAGTFTVTVDATANCNDFDASGITNTLRKMTLTGASALNIYGSWINPGGTFYADSMTGVRTFSATSTGKTITTNGVTWSVANGGGGGVVFNGVGGGWTLGSAFTTSGSDGGLWFTNGTFDTGGFNVTTKGVRNQGTGTTVLNFNGSTITLNALNGAGGIEWDLSNGTGLTLNAGSSTIAFSAGTGATQHTFAAAAGQVYNNVTSAGTGTLAFTGSGYTIANLTANSPSGVGYNLLSVAGNFTVSGVLTLGSTSTPTFRFSIRSTVLGTPRTITVNGSVALSCVDFRDITAAGSAGAWTGTNLGDLGGNTSITTTTPKTVYWNLSGSQLWSATGWATTNNGTPDAANFPLAQDTAVFTEAGAAGTVTFDVNWAVGNIQMADGVSNRTTAFTLATAAITPTFYGSVTLFSALVLSGTGVLTFSGRGTQSINSSGVSWTQPITVDSISGTYQLAAAQTIAATVTFIVNSGGLNLNGFGLSAGLFNTSGSLTKPITSGGGSISSTSTTTATPVNLNVTGVTLVDRPSLLITGNNTTVARAVECGSFAEAVAPDVNVSAGSSNIVVRTNLHNLVFSGTATGQWLNRTANFYGDLTLNGGMTLEAGANILTFAATSGTKFITSAAQTIDAPVTFNGVGGTFKFADTFRQGSTRTITLTNGTLDGNGQAVFFSVIGLGVGTKTLTIGSGTWSVSGAGTAWAANTNVSGLTVTPAQSGKISMTSASAKTFAGGGLSWPILEQAGAGTLTITQANSFADLQASAAGAGSTVTLPSSVTQTLAAFTLGGTAGNRVSLNASGVGTRATISKASGTVDAVHLSVKDSAATGGATWNAPTTLDNANAGNNTGWDFATHQAGQASSSPLSAMAHTPTKSTLAASSVVAALARSPAKLLLVANSPLATVAKALARALQASTAAVASALAQVVHPRAFAATAGAAALLSRSTGKLALASAATVTAITRSPAKLARASTAPLVSMVRAFAKALLVSMSPAAARSTTMSPAAFTASTSALASSSRSTGKLARVAGSVVAAITRSPAKGLAVTTGPLATLLRSVAKALSAAVSPVARRTSAISPAAFVTSTAALASASRSTGKIARVAGSAIASIVRNPAKAATATTAPVATLVRSLARALSTAATAVASRASVIALAGFTAAASALASLSRVTGKTAATETTPAGSLTTNRGYQRLLNAASSPVASLVSMSLKALAAVAGVIADIRYTIPLKVHAVAAIAPIATVSKELSRSLSATAGSIARFVHYVFGQTPPARTIFARFVNRLAIAPRVNRVAVALPQTRIAIAKDSDEMLRWDDKDIADVADYLLDFTQLLDGDTIDTLVSADGNGVDVVSSHATATGVTVWLSGGVRNALAVVTIIVDTTAGRRFERDVSIYIAPTRSVADS